METRCNTGETASQTIVQRTEAFYIRKNIFMPLLPIIAPIFLFIPGATAFFARSMGRNFWIWFGLGMLLPLVSFVILWFMPAKQENPVTEN